MLNRSLVALSAERICIPLGCSRANLTLLNVRSISVLLGHKHRRKLLLRILPGLLQLSLPLRSVPLLIRLHPFWMCAPIRPPILRCAAWCTVRVHCAGTPSPPSHSNICPRDVGWIPILPIRHVCVVVIRAVFRACEHNKHALHPTVLIHSDRK